MINSLSRWACCLLLTLSLTACWGSGQQPDTNQTATAASDAVATSVPPPTPDRIKALGVLRPRQTLSLSFRSGGLITTLASQIGAQVRKGEQLAVIDSADLILALENAKAAVAIQQAQYELIANNPQKSQPERAIAQAELQQAQIALDRLTLQLAGAVIEAPFDGIISAIHAHPSEVVNAGQTVIELIDTTGWLVETNNVSELNISRIAIGQPVTVTVIVFPNQPLTGKVIAIDPVAIVQQGDTTYTLYIELIQNDLPLLAGMNVEVEIVIDKE